MAATVTIDFNANLARFSSSIDKATADLNKFQTNAQRMASNVKGAFAALGVGVVAGAFAAFAKNTLDAADSLEDLSDRTGVAVKDLAGLAQAAKLADTDLDSVGKGIAKLSLSFSQAQGGSKEVAESLKRLGVNSTDARERFFQLADAYQKAGGDTRVLADLQKVLGKSYTDLIPLLKQGGDELRRSAQETESFADAMARLAPEAGKFNDHLDKIKQNAAGVSAQFLSAVIPSLNEYLGALQAIIDKGTTLEKIGFFTLGFIPAHVLDEQATTVDELGQRIDSYRQRIAELQASGKDASAEIAIFNSLLEKQIKLLQAPPKRSGSGTGDFPKTTATAKADPLASLLKSTDIGKLREFEKQVALLNERFNYGKKESELYAQAMTKLVESTFANNFKQAAEDAEFMNAVLEDGENTVREYGKAWEEAGAALTDEMRTPLENLNLELGRLQELLDRGAISWETYTRAVLAAEDKMGAGSEQIKTTKSLAEELNIVFESAFTKAIEGGAGFQDVMKGLLADVIKLIAQMLILEPLLKSIKDGLGASSATSSGGSFNFGSLFSDIGSGIASFFGFANGGVMTPAGPLPLNKYAMGGIANSPQLAMFGEGSRPEAYVPLPDGRRIPVQMSGGGGGQVVNNITIKTDDPSTVRASRGQLLADISNQMQRANRWR